MLVVDEFRAILFWITFVFICLILVLAVVQPSFSWSNGGFSSDPLNPKYGTHDWIAEHALDWLPIEAKKWLIPYKALYLYGTELPDNGQVSDGIGDTQLHHIYFYANGTLMNDSSAVRANATYRQALSYMLRGDFATAAKYAGAMTHYISDVAVFGHVMGKETPWGEEKHHSDYEKYVNDKTSGYNAEFNIYLQFDGKLEIITAYDAAVKLAYDTTFDSLGRGLTCVWMDQNYNWSNPVFRNRVGESLNLAVNYVADVLYTLYMEACSLDNIPPEISEPWQDPPPDNVQPFQNVTIWVSVVDYGTGVKNVTLWYSISNGANWMRLNMTEISAGMYKAIIPGCKNCTWVTYKIVVYDNAGNSAIKDNNGYGYKYHVIPEIPQPVLLSLILINLTLIMMHLKAKQILDGL